MRFERPRFTLLSVIFVAASLVMMGCATHLENTATRPSPYQGNTVLYQQDVAITTTSDSLKDFLGWEMRYRGIIPPEVTKFADNVRVNLPNWNASAIRLRDAYATNPTPQNANALRGALNELQQALIEATLYMTQNKALK